MLRTEAVTSTGENPQKLLNIGLCHGFFDLTTEADTNKWDNVKLKKKKKKTVLHSKESETESESHSVVSDSLRPPGVYTVWAIFQDRIVEWVALPFSRASSQPRNRILVSHIAGRFFTS